MQAAPLKFAIHCVVAISPFLFVVILMEAFLWRSGEIVSMRSLARNHGRGGPPAAYSPILSSAQSARLHYERILAQRPDVLVLGSSRVSRFRAEMLAPETNFYNASWCVRSVRDVEDFVAAWPDDYAPKTLLIGIDETWFSPKTPAPAHIAHDIATDEYVKPAAHAYAYQNLVKALLRGQIKGETILRIILGRDEGISRFGLGAWQKENFPFEVWRLGGFRNDGGVQEFDRETPAALQDPWMPERFRYIRKGLSPYEPVEGPDQDRTRRFVSVLEKLEQKGTHIIGYFPPMATAIWNVIEEKPIIKQFFISTVQTITSEFLSHGWTIFDARRVESFGLDDRAMCDGMHARDTLHVALLLRMAEDPSTQHALHIEPEKLRTALNHPATTPWYPVFEPAEKNTPPLAAPQPNATPKSSN